MQQMWTVPQRLLVRLPPGLGLEPAALAEPLAVAVHDVRRAAVARGERVLVVGGGPIGLLIACVAAAEGAEVAVSEPDRHRRALAARLGFPVIDPATADLGATLSAWTGGAGADAAFEASGSITGLDAATHALRVRGRLVVVAIHNKPVPVDLFRVFWRELTLIGARVYERRDFRRAVALLAAEAVPAAELISAVEPLGRAGAAFEALESGSGVMKMLIDCRARA
jgi:2-desacetyl-2-hydroxyethyl bacteriochlorophyllide A dehydrogenase